jgi:hypothetical protein
MTQLCTDLLRPTLNETYEKLPTNFSLSSVAGGNEPRNETINAALLPLNYMRNPLIEAVDFVIQKQLGT